MPFETLFESPKVLGKFSPSSVVLRLMREAMKPDADFGVLAEIIRMDPGLAVSILNLVNSPFYGITKKVSDIQRAAVVLGSREVLKLALVISLKGDADRQLKKAGYDPAADWRLAVWSAVAAEVISSRLCPAEADMAYLGGLLKDVALIYMRYAAPDMLPDMPADKPLTMLRSGQIGREDEAWGMQHGDVSRLLLAKWGLPPELGNAVARHHDLEGLEGLAPIQKAVTLATCWAEAELGAGGGPFAFIRFGHRLRVALDFSDAELEEMREECRRRYEAMLRSLGVEAPKAGNGGYLAHSIKAMQEAYFMSMDLLTAEGGVESVSHIVGRHLRLGFDVNDWDLALRAPHGGGYHVFHCGADACSLVNDVAESDALLPWRAQGRSIPLRFGDRKWGELRLAQGDIGEETLASLELYARFLAQAYEHYCAKQAVLEEKAQAFDSLPLGVARTDGEGNIVEVNRRFGEILLQDGGVLRGRPLAVVLDEGLGLRLGQEWDDLLYESRRRNMNRIVCFTERRGKETSDVCAYLSAHKEGDPGHERILVLMENLRQLSRMEVQALKRRDFLERLVGAMRDLVFTVDSQGLITFSSLDGEEGRGESLFDKFSPDETFTGTWGPSLLDQPGHGAVEASLPQADGGRRPFELVFSSLGQGGNGSETLVVARDMAAVRRLEKELKVRAIYDALTGLFNHAQFRIVLEREVQRTRRTKRPLGLIFFDLDGFKGINDTQGHQAGDSILRLVGEILHREVRQGMDFPCRYGGDEFAIIVTEAAEKSVETIAERLRAAVEEKFSGKVTLSAGMSVLGPSDTPDSFLHNADRAAYEAKAKGGNAAVWAR